MAFTTTLRLEPSPEWPFPTQGGRSASAAPFTEHGYARRSYFVLVCAAGDWRDERDPKLAAILAADVVGFTVSPARTRIARSRGFGRCAATSSIRPSPCITAASSSAPATAAIVEFRSVVDAVRCAIEVQNAMVERNAGVPEDRRIVFRIGIHLGDIVEESDGDLMGDGSTSPRDWRASPHRARSASPRTPTAR